MRPPPYEKHFTAIMDELNKLYQGWFDAQSFHQYRSAMQKIVRMVEWGETQVLNLLSYGIDTNSLLLYNLQQVKNAIKQDRRTRMLLDFHRDFPESIHGCCQEITALKSYMLSFTSTLGWYKKIQEYTEISDPSSFLNEQVKKTALSIHQLVFRLITINRSRALSTAKFRHEHEGRNQCKRNQCKRDELEAALSHLRSKISPSAADALLTKSISAAYPSVTKLSALSGLLFVYKKERGIKAPSRVTLPEPIKHIFSQFKTLSGRAYLAGSTVTALLQGNFLSKNYDFDFIVHCAPEELQPLDFIKDKYLPNLYHYFYPGYCIDIFCDNSPSTTPEDWLKKTVEKRDFTISSILCDEDGKIIDLLGGYKDLLSNTLRSIGDPATRLGEDPKLPFRAIKHMTNNFEPTEDLKEALLNWQPNETINVGAVCALIRKHLSTLNNESYRSLLEEFELLGKLDRIFSQKDNPLTWVKAPTPKKQGLQLTAPPPSQQYPKFFSSCSDCGSTPREGTKFGHGSS